jgi:glycosyltransferase involved in cell wall biosynthesis
MSPAPNAARRVVMALFFFPRGGSAYVARHLTRLLPGVGWEPTLVAGSLGAPGDATHAPGFFAGTDVRPVDYTAAGHAVDPLEAEVPFQPSYEDRPGAPDRVFARVGDGPYERLVTAWEKALGQAGAAAADVLHLHHLTPANEAAARSLPAVPVVGHLHGTELLMLREIQAGPPPHWVHARAWAERMRRWAGRCDRLVVQSADAAAQARTLLGVDPAKVSCVPNGVDIARFDRRPAGGDERLAFWRRWLVDDPQGWDGSGVPGSVRYAERDLDPFREGGPVLLYVGRFTAVKRVGLLVRAYAQARHRFRVRAPLVLLGGHPGELEGRHPLDEIRGAAVPDVFLAGWRPQDALPGALNAADLLVLPSVAEQFGQVLVEAMACGLPVVAVNAHGPATIVEPGRTGWLVPPDDLEALAAALVAAVNDPAGRARMGDAGWQASRSRFSLQAVVAGVAGAYAAALPAGPDLPPAGH